MAVFIWLYSFLSCCTALIDQPRFRLTVFGSNFSNHLAASKKFLKIFERKNNSTLLKDLVSKLSDRRVIVMKPWAQGRSRMHLRWLTTSSCHGVIPTERWADSVSWYEWQMACCVDVCYWQVEVLVCLIQGLVYWCFCDWQVALRILLGLVSQSRIWRLLQDELIKLKNWPRLTWSSVRKIMSKSLILKGETFCHTRKEGT